LFPTNNNQTQLFEDSRLKKKKQLYFFEITTMAGRDYVEIFEDKKKYLKKI
jgi:hypothetical protein